MHGIESFTTAAISTALDAASLRQQVIAANVANAGRSDYSVQRATFEATVSGLLSQLTGSSAPSPASPASMSSASTAGQRVAASTPIELRMHVDADPALDGGVRPVQLDTEMGALAQNSLHYQALVRGLSKYLSVMASAVSEGKR